MKLLLISNDFILIWDIMPLLNPANKYPFKFAIQLIFLKFSIFDSISFVFTFIINPYNSVDNNTFSFLKEKLFISVSKEKRSSSLFIKKLFSIFLF